MGVDRVRFLFIHPYRELKSFTKQFYSETSKATDFKFIGLNFQEIIHVIYKMSNESQFQ